MDEDELHELMTAADSVMDHFEPETPEWQAVVDLASAVKRLARS